MSEQLPRRRVDDVDPATQLFVKDELAETRHWMRDELAALGTKVELATATSTKEHAEVKAALGLILAANFESRVAALERKDVEESAAAAAVDKLGLRIRWAAMFVVGAVGAATAVLVAVFG